MQKAQSLFQRIVLVLTLLAWTAATGVHWDVLQIVAYGKMTVNFSTSKNLTLAQAAAKALSGEAPCTLCKMVSAAKGANANDAPTIATASTAGTSGKAPIAKKTDLKKLSHSLPPPMAGLPTIAMSFAPRLVDADRLPPSPALDVPAPPPKPSALA
ncbi:MAG: hypothetical protein LBD14_04285 [Puniceicoccales bacterium]|jgi:hypothetical protein|nr:hypothetical protein [Puniceicoccales bacterium]